MVNASSIEAITFDKLITPEEKLMLENMLIQIPTIRENLRKAKRLGLDTESPLAELEESERKIRALLAEL